MLCNYGILGLGLSPGFTVRPRLALSQKDDWQLPPMSGGPRSTDSVQGSGECIVDGLWFVCNTIGVDNKMDLDCVQINLRLCQMRRADRMHPGPNDANAPLTIGPLQGLKL